MMHRAAHDRALDRARRPRSTTLPFDARLGVHRAVDAALDRVEDQAVGLEHVLELAGVLPPAFDDVRPHLEAAIDQVLDGVGDLELVPEARLDALDRRRRPRGRTCRRRRARDRSSAPSASRRAGRRGRRPARRRRTSAGRARAVEQNLRRRPLALELLDEPADAAIQQVVAEVHDERIAVDERLADEHRVRQAARRVLLDVGRPARPSASRRRPRRGSQPACRRRRCRCRGCRRRRAPRARRRAPACWRPARAAWRWCR